MKMQVKIRDFKIKKMVAKGNHIYLKGRIETEFGLEAVEIFFRDTLEEKRVFSTAELTIKGDFVRSEAGPHLVNARILHIELLTELPLEGLSIKDRLNASGLIHEFRDIFRKDKIRAMEILKVLGVSEKMAEEILLRNSYILPFI